MSPAEVHIEVTVNVDSWRRGQRHQVALTSRIEALELIGYIKILGHVNPPAPEPQPVAPKVASPRRVKAKTPPEVVTNGDSQSPA